MTERLLIVELVGGRTFRGDGRRFAGAVFARQDDGTWRCVRVAPALYWWANASMENIEKFLKGPAKLKGWRYRWARRFEIESGLPL